MGTHSHSCHFTLDGKINKLSVRMYYITHYYKNGQTDWLMDTYIGVSMGWEMNGLIDN